MGRPVYPHELKDPDFSWLISNYTERNPKCFLVDRSLTPIVLIPHNDEARVAAELDSEEASAAPEGSPVKESEI